ncbi:hypothetical protein SPOG_02721 [Schizosaccharomyces cryophilus OY26]|uniref:MEMO1 family protein n=1 Tax=Schizosaccharomyces cryophilus (strain OY26 / ATCC MYA-4695 / CBS 11777 / NBRC 106824 / NRRL Y48691) TaxID=653667 RepID=S9XCG7_SCHCR|nr:uncharacterized protein SPOG_02721 [Schizosaccharomyces cryophilus OY26]EPY51551.1 hypothetical protein SPOG_02721 [Schizosaccharomyces cryophilus OY26]
MDKMRNATHAGSWYIDNPTSLEKQLGGFTYASDPPIEGKRFIISPHAGYMYSGSTATQAFQRINFENRKRVFILGPSHHVFTRKCLVSQAEACITPFGNLTVDREVCQDIIEQNDNCFNEMSLTADEEEHSIEMQFPLLAYHLQKQGCLDRVKIVPIMVGALSSEAIQTAANILCNYIVDEKNVFIVSSDFCHWGRRFGYTMYLNETNDLEDAIISFRRRGSIENPKIYESISALDHMGMKIISTKSSREFGKYIRLTHNTICGRYPIQLILKSMELAQVSNQFEFIAYAQSNRARNVSDSSVSYAAAIA